MKITYRFSPEEIVALVTRNLSNPSGYPEAEVEVILSPEPLSPLLPESISWQRLVDMVETLRSMQGSYPGLKIERIKHFRAEMGCTLGEAKRFVELLFPS